MNRKLGLVICVLLLLFSAVSHADSAIVWNGHTYKLFLDKVLWSTAKKKCEDAGGYLAVINSKEEQDFICKLIMNRRGEAFWIGLTDEATEGTWIWINGEETRFTNWAPKEPNNADGNQDHACIHSMAQDWGESLAKPGQWDDDYYESLNGYICEWDTPTR